MELMRFYILNDAFSIFIVSVKAFILNLWQGELNAIRKAAEP